MANVLDSLIGTYGSVFDIEFSEIADILLNDAQLIHEEEEIHFLTEAVVSCYEYQGKLYELWYHVQTPDSLTLGRDLGYGFNTTTKNWE